jgi:hypothetical protein
MIRGSQRQQESLLALRAAHPANRFEIFLAAE